LGFLFLASSMAELTLSVIAFMGLVAALGHLVIGLRKLVLAVCALSKALRKLVHEFRQWPRTLKSRNSTRKALRQFIDPFCRTAFARQEKCVRTDTTR
jgi:hypothetical protein